jgi:hypothetical protein
MAEKSAVSSVALQNPLRVLQNLNLHVAVTVTVFVAVSDLQLTSARQEAAHAF